MSSFIENEAKGDWRNFKGDHYHLVYLVWSLLHEDGTVAFYQGNDLLRQTPMLLPSKIDESAEAAPLVMQSQKAEMDEWIQLKATASVRWGCSAIIRELLGNFVFNALISKSKGRQWEAKLVTTSTIDGAKIREFVAEYDKSNTDIKGKKEFN